MTGGQVAALISAFLLLLLGGCFLALGIAIGHNSDAPAAFFIAAAIFGVAGLLFGIAFRNRGSRGPQ